MDADSRPGDTYGSCKLTPSCLLALSPPIYPGRGGKLTLCVHLWAPHMSASCLIYRPPALGLQPVPVSGRRQEELLSEGLEFHGGWGGRPPESLWQQGGGRVVLAQHRPQRDSVHGLL